MMGWPAEPEVGLGVVSYGQFTIDPRDGGQHESRWWGRFEKRPRWGRGAVVPNGIMHWRGGPFTNGPYRASASHTGATLRRRTQIVCTEMVGGVPAAFPTRV